MCYITCSLRFTSGVTPADLLVSSMAAELSLPHTCKALISISLIRLGTGTITGFTLCKKSQTLLCAILHYVHNTNNQYNILANNTVIDRETSFRHLNCISGISSRRISASIFFFVHWLLRIYVKKSHTKRVRFNICQEGGCTYVGKSIPELNEHHVERHQ